MSLHAPFRFRLDDPAPGLRQRDAKEEAQMIERLGGGDIESLNQLWEVWSRPLFAIAVRALSSTEDAEEVLQDALVRFCKKARSYDSAKCQPFTWAVMILRGLIQDKLRARRRRPVLVSNELHVNRSSTMAYSGQHADLEQAISLLTPEERQALEVAVFQPSTHEEISIRLGQPLGTIKTRIRRALEKLRAVLTDDAP